MKLDVLKQLLAVPSHSFKEQQMVAWLCEYIHGNIPGATVTVDASLNVYVHKGTSQFSPCVAAHIDTVQPMRPVNIVESNGCLIGYDEKGRQCGIGADDKTGVFVGLSLLERFSHIRAVFFAAEECGCVGARNVDPVFMDGLSFLMEFDCPSRNMMSYTSGGVRLFENNGLFINSVLPALKKHGTTLWQKHPYTDVMAIRKVHPISCLNLSSGYYNWHAPNEYVSVDDVNLAIEQGAAVIGSLEYMRYGCPVDLREDVVESLIPITPLSVPTGPNPFACPPPPAPSCV